MKKEVREYLLLVKSWWWLLVIGAIIPAFLANYFLSQEPDVYQATATLVVGNTLQNPEPNQWQLSIANTLAYAYARIAREEPVTQAVVNRLGLDRRPSQLAGQITTRVYAEAQLLEIEVVDTSPVAAALIANALADELIRRSPISQEDQVQRQAFIREQLDDLEARIELVDAEIVALQNSLTSLTSAVELQEAQNRLSQLESVKLELQGNYSSLLASYQTQVPNIVSIFDPAVEPTSPLPRRDKLVILIAAVAGFGLAAGGIFLIEFLDDTVRWEGESVQRLAGLPVLGMIARMPYKDGAVFRSVDPLAPSMEAVRTLRTNVFMAANGQPLRSLLVTSPMVGDGKSFTVSMLALAIVGGGRRVAMIDADLRKPSLHELFDLPNVYGLSELLMKQHPSPDASWTAGVLETGVENLYLLPAGKPPLDPSYLLSEPHIAAMVGCLLEHVDVVLIDSPPDLVAPDACILAAVADGALLVVRAGKTRRAMVERAKSRLEERGGSRLLGLAINRVKFSSYGYYYYSYGAGHLRTRRSVWRRLWARLPFVKDSAQQERVPEAVGLRRVADYLGVSRNTARRWCHEGRVPATRSRLRWRVRLDDLEAVVVQAARGCPPQGEALSNPVAETERP
ncbi:MAG: polysaccharide biosynthesis tyrosine autokinase [Anaerolineae bacterium]|nr:polysaccharide biosynthesis tyrosine autokinase [Anaerolineae bacterium]